MLLEESMVECVLLDKVTKADGYGGVTTEWTDGATIRAAIILDSSINALRAQKEGVTGVYTVLTERTVVLRFHDVLRRKADGLVLRVTTNGDDQKTPDSSALDLRSVRAEEWDFHG